MPIQQLQREEEPLFALLKGYYEDPNEFFPEVLDLPPAPTPTPTSAPALAQQTAQVVQQPGLSGDALKFALQDALIASQQSGDFNTFNNALFQNKLTEQDFIKLFPQIGANLIEEYKKNKGVKFYEPVAQPDFVDDLLASQPEDDSQFLQTVTNPYSGTNVYAANTGQTFPYDAIIAQINSQYQQGKTPALAVKSALQLGIPLDVIKTFPGVDDAAIAAGQQMISSGAFAATATGNQADSIAATGVPQYGTAQYNARISMGLDAFGFPPEQVALLTQQGRYGPGKEYDPDAASGAPSETAAANTEDVYIDPLAPTDHVDTANSDTTWSEYTGGDRFPTPVTGFDGQPAYDTWGLEGMSSDYALSDALIPKDFDWKEYVRNSPDFVREGIDTEGEARRHYAQFGYRENRAGSGTATNYGQLAAQLTDLWSNLPPEIAQKLGIGGEGINKEIGGRPLPAVAGDLANILANKGIKDLNQLPDGDIAWSAAGNGNVSYKNVNGVPLPFWGSSSDAAQARQLAIAAGLAFITGGQSLAGAIGSGIGSGIGTTLGLTLSPAAATALGTGVLSTGVAKLGGADWEDALKAGVGSGLGSYAVSSLTGPGSPISKLGKDFSGTLFDVLGGSDLAGSIADFGATALEGGLKGAAKSGVGALVTGQDIGDALITGAMGGATGEVLGEYMTDIPELKNLPKPVKDAILAGAVSAAKSGDKDKAGFAALNAFIGSAIKGSDTAKEFGKSFEEFKREGIDAIKSVFGMGAGEITGGEGLTTYNRLDEDVDPFRVSITGEPYNTDPLELLGLVEPDIQSIKDIVIPELAANNKVLVTGKKDKGEPEIIEPLEIYGGKDKNIWEKVNLPGTKNPPEQKVNVTGQKNPPEQTVDVIGGKFPPDEFEPVEIPDTKFLGPDIFDQPTTTKKDDTIQKVEVEGEKIKDKPLDLTEKLPDVDIPKPDIPKVEDKKPPKDEGKIPTPLRPDPVLPELQLPSGGGGIASLAAAPLANVFYYGKEFGGPRQRLTSRGTLELDEYKPLSVTKAGAIGEKLEEEEIAARKQREENRGSLIDRLLEGEEVDSASSLDEILNFIGVGRG